MTTRDALACVLAALVLLAAGCAGTAYKAKVPSTDGMACVTDFAEIPRLQLRQTDTGGTQKPGHVEFADVAQCYRIGDAATPLALYAFEGLTLPADVTVSVQLSSGGTFAAAVEILDAQYRSLQRHGFNAFVRRGDEYSLTVFLEEAGATPAYLLLTPDREKVGQKDIAIGSVSSPVLIPAGPVMFVYNKGSEASSVREFLAGGRVKIMVKARSMASF